MLEGMGDSERVGVGRFGWVGAILFLMLALAGCQSGERLAWVDGVSASEGDTAGAPWLGMGSDGLGQRTLSALGRSPGIGVLGKGQKAPDGKAWSARVEVIYMRTLPPPDGSPAPIAPHRAEVALQITLARQTEARIQGEGRGSREYLPGDAEVRAAAFSQALDRALEDAATQLSLHLELSSRNEAQLVAELQSNDVKRRDFASRILAERGSAVAIPYLLERLEDKDRTSQLRAVGSLVAIKDVSAVPRLIDATLGRDPSFVAQIAYALGEIGGEEAEAYLFTASTGHPENRVRQAAEEALVGLRAKGSATGAGGTEGRARQVKTSDG